ncbi:hypothetical protein ACFONG_02270 [Uliginosibacterium paludis]|uniref:Uncharacterized protein n=1 Tax=Uliginosibacterium paludis TaxID=1615952 RepID=A0ABV2CSX0_9RHOO
MRRLSAWLMMLLLAACAGSAERGSPAGTADTPATKPPASTPDKSPVRITQGSASTISRADKQRILAQMQASARPITLERACSFHNETGYKGSTRVNIRNGEVVELATTYEIPDYGICRIEKAGFRQVASTPSIELRHADGCTARIWTQGRQLTISYTRCAARCSRPEAFSYVWPVLIDQPSGRCD